MEADVQTQIAVLQEKMAGLESARALQAAEYARRLEELNHAHAKAEQKNSDYLPREVFETRMSQLLSWQHEVDRTLSEMTGSKAGLTAAIGIVLSALALALTLLPHWSS